MNIIESFKKLFIHKTDHSGIQFLRYFFVGGTAFIVDFGALYIFTEYLHIYYLTSACLSFTAGTIVNYLISVFWVFQKRNLKNRSLEILIFVAIGIIGLILNLLIIWMLTEKSGIHYLASKIISTILVYCWNFFARKLILYK